MKKHYKSMTYTCSVCGEEYTHLESVRDCEADHLGLTPEEVDTWIILIDSGDQKRLAEFERKHNLEDAEIPENWEFLEDAEDEL